MTLHDTLKPGNHATKTITYTRIRNLRNYQIKHLEQPVELLMTLHDTWVDLKPGNPYERILHLFPNRMIPMRDPFALELTTNSEGKTFNLWIIDGNRLSSIQSNSIAEIIANHYNALHYNESR